MQIKIFHFYDNVKSQIWIFHFLQIAPKFPHRAAHIFWRKILCINIQEWKLKKCAKSIKKYAVLLQCKDLSFRTDIKINVNYFVECAIYHPSSRFSVTNSNNTIWIEGGGGFLVVVLFFRVVALIWKLGCLKEKNYYDLLLTECLFW